MNLYIIVEGEQTELKAYPKWIEYKIPELIKIDDYRDAIENKYFTFSGGGIPNIYNHIANAILDINQRHLYQELHCYHRQ